MRRFPGGFLFGVATSGHQTEGDNTSSDTWFLEHVGPTVFAERSGRACFFSEALDRYAAIVDSCARRLAGPGRARAVRPVLRPGHTPLR
ncbi:hypothetical protein ACN27F_19645 [Solwaraspora sp. WMMB335]|uniref:hypothetical protein n=1 Tax=Solwaraspora sp. WMMB335 TaxID=3404118 RepID=UPI003B93C3F7